MMVGDDAAPDIRAALELYKDRGEIFRSPMWRLRPSETLWEWSCLLETCQLSEDQAIQFPRLAASGPQGLSEATRILQFLLRGQDSGCITSGNAAGWFYWEYHRALRNIEETSSPPPPPGRPPCCGPAPSGDPPRASGVAAPLSR